MRGVIVEATERRLLEDESVGLAWAHQEGTICSCDGETQWVARS